MRVILVGGPLDGARTRLRGLARLEVFLVGRVPVGVTLDQFEAALNETGAAASPAGRRALTLLASRSSAARYIRSDCRWSDRMWCWRKARRYDYVDQGPLWVTETRGGARLAVTAIPDYPPA